MKDADTYLLRDGLVLAASIIGAVALVKTEILTTVLSAMQESSLIGSFIAGLFFTSIFTTAPAIVVLGELARGHDLLVVALVGASGAVIGDLIILKFISSRFSHHIVEIVSHRRIGNRVMVLLKRKLFRWVSFFIGGMIIAFPMLPDELGLGFIGISQMKTSWVIALSYTFNVIGIVIIGLIARAI